MYRARDTTLNRDVALKVLPEHFALDLDRLARFKREAQVLASLNHPNIAAIYGFEESNGVQALVLELVEGPTLADRIAQGPLPLDEALRIARQIAEALEAAHEQGIIHRDLKPANIKVRDDGTVKVLDFGLAKALEPAGVTSPSVSQSPTITSPAMTQMGVILGTAAYMSPEQAKGRAADRRSDMWAFACVLYEMLTGRRAFEGDDVSDTLAAVLRGDPDWTGLPQQIPIPIRRLLRHCLAKDPKVRIGDASTARIEIIDSQSEIAGPGAQAGAHRRIPLVWASALALVTLMTGGAIAWMLKPASESSVPFTRFSITLPTGQQFSSPGHRPLAVSPDGTAIVYTANEGLHLQPLDQLESTPIRGTQGTGNAAGRSPFFSPDGQWIGYWQAGQFKKVPIAGGAPTLLGSARNPWGASWTAENAILYGQGTEGIWRVSGDGGKPENLVKVDADQIASGPQLLPGGRAILFTLTRPTDPDARQIVVQSLDTGTRRVVLEGGSTDARYVSTGHLVYAVESTLLAVPFDVATLAVTGGPVQLVEDVARSPDGVMSYFAVSNDGTLVYVPTDAVSGSQQRTLVWVDRQGREAPIKVQPRAYFYPRLSPDGTRVIVSIRDQENDIWIWNLFQETLMRLTFGPAYEIYAIWTADGQSVIFNSGPSPAAFAPLYRQASDGTGTIEQLTQGNAAQYPSAVTPDGKGLIFQDSALQLGGTVGDRGDLMLLPLMGDRSPQPLVQTPFIERNGEISPDGLWLAYTSNKSGRFEVYVRPFSNVGGELLVSRSGGTQPLWARNGTELFYESMGALMRVSLTTVPTLAAGTPSKLFDKGVYFLSALGRNYDVSRDGQRFLMIKEGSPTDQPSRSARFILVQHWFEELKRRVPTN